MIPSSALGLHLLDREFRPCLQYWLGVPIFPEGTRCPVCQALADPFGDHHVGCGGNGDRIYRHNSIRRHLFSSSICSFSAKEGVTIPHTRYSSSSSGCFSAKLGQGPVSCSGRLCDLHSSTSHPTRGSHHARTCFVCWGIPEDGSACSACRSVGVSFVPPMVESLGGWSELASKTISNIGRHLGQRLGVPPSDSIQHLFQKCSVALWRGNASLWLHRFPSVSPHIDSVIQVSFFCVIFILPFFLFVLFINGHEYCCNIKKKKVLYCSPKYAESDGTFTTFIAVTSPKL